MTAFSVLDSGEGLVAAVAGWFCPCSASLLGARLPINAIVVARLCISTHFLDSDVGNPGSSSPPSANRSPQEPAHARTKVGAHHSVPRRPRHRPRARPPHHGDRVPGSPRAAGDDGSCPESGTSASPLQPWLRVRRRPDRARQRLRPGHQTAIEPSAPAPAPRSPSCHLAMH
jgi:hypothetical protein